MLSFQKHVSLPPSPPQHNVENHKKLQVVVFNIVWEEEGGGGGGWGARLGR